MIQSQNQKAKKSIAGSHYQKFRQSKHQAKESNPNSRHSSDYLMGMVLPDKAQPDMIPEEQSEADRENYTSINSEEAPPAESGILT